MTWTFIDVDLDVSKKKKAIYRDISKFEGPKYPIPSSVISSFESIWLEFYLYAYKKRRWNTCLYNSSPNGTKLKGRQ